MWYAEVGPDIHGAAYYDTEDETYTPLPEYITETAAWMYLHEGDVFRDGSDYYVVQRRMWDDVSEEDEDSKTVLLFEVEER